MATVIKTIGVATAVVQNVPEVMARLSFVKLPAQSRDQDRLKAMPEFDRFMLDRGFAVFTNAAHRVDPGSPVLVKAHEVTIIEGGVVI